MRSTGLVNKILVLAPKRYFKKAVDRNLLRRRIKESYRLNKGMLPDGGMNIFISYIAKEILDYSFIEEKLKEVLKQIADAAAGEK